MTYYCVSCTCTRTVCVPCCPYRSHRVTHRQRTLLHSTFAVVWEVRRSLCCIHALTTLLPTPTYMHSPPYYPLPHTCTHQLTTHSHIHALTTSLPTPTYMHSPPDYPLPHTCTHHLTTHSHIHALTTLLPTPTYMHSPHYYPLPHTCTHHLITHSH